MNFSTRLAECPEQAAARQTGSLAGLAVTLTLVVFALYLVNTLRAQAELQDCVMSGRPGCAVNYYH